MNQQIPVVLPERQPAIRVVAMPADTNPGGCIFGGWIMSHVDVAGAIAAIEVARGRVVTVAVNAMEFHEPVFVGDLVSYYAEVLRVGRTSITVKVDVYAQRSLDQPRIVKVTEAQLTYVAIGDDRRPRMIGTRG